MRVATDYLKGRILEVNLADLNKDEDQNYRKIKLQMLDVSGKHCLTNFYGMDMTTDKIRSLVKKWQVGRIQLNLYVDTIYGDVSLWIFDVHVQICALCESLRVNTNGPSSFQTTIECVVDVNTIDGYKLRMSCIAVSSYPLNHICVSDLFCLFFFIGVFLWDGL